MVSRSGSNTSVAVINAFAGTLRECNHEVAGICRETAKSGKGYVVYKDFDYCSESFINLPGINLLPTWLLAVMWGLFLLWAFFGVAVISDAFVEGIEVIIGTKKMFKRHDAMGRVVYREEPVWNWAVASITLLAVGSSSPEILLALVETLLTLGQEPGNIGPSCIIGSASYNLFGIIAICTLSLPNGVFKKIEHTKVFWWTTVWSVWANIWLYLAYKQITPGTIDIWEAFLTLGQMPVFVYTTYLVDVKGFNWFGVNKNAIVPDEALEEGSKDVSIVNQEHLAETAAAHHHSILYYRNLAVQQMAGKGHREAHRLTASGEPQSDVAGPADEANLDMASLEAMDKDVAKVMFVSPEMSILESAGEARVQVIRMHGNIADTLFVHYTCKDDTAVAGLDYVPVEGTLVFGPGQELREVVVKIMDDDMSEPDVAFNVILSAAQVEGGGHVKILRHQTEVTIVDDDDGGVAGFELPTFEVGMNDTHAKVVVVRRNGSDGRVTVDYATKEGSALAGKHFKDMQGTLTFNSGETRKSISIPLLPASSPVALSPMLAFRLTLSNPLGGLVLGSRSDCRVAFVPGSKLGGSEAGVGSTKGEGEGFNLWSAWRDRFKDCLMPEFDEDSGDNIWIAMSLHYISITFKLITAFVPPAGWKGGYPCFFVSLFFLGLLMAVVTEVAHMFGCAVGLSELMTGMSIVAFGTSLPDTFASRFAALADPNADAAIGNVTGSNCANVFLGLGIPWVVATLYSKAVGEIYVVSAGPLGFSVMLFCIFAVVAIIILIVRRQQGGELGGTRSGQLWTASAFVLLWLLFLILTGLYDYGHLPRSGL